MRLKRGSRGWWIALAAALVDRLTKLMAAALPAGGRALIPGVIDLRRVHNRGMAFSMLSGQTVLLAALTALLIAGIVGWLLARPDAGRVFRAGLWLIVGGGLGNLYDRLTAGSVPDFIELAFTRFAVFNIADVCVCAGAALVVVGSLTPRRDGP